ncbi:MAG: hypothetical protein AB7O52_19865 [Planctomycetota bacterium]
MLLPIASDDPGTALPVAERLRGRPVHQISLLFSLISLYARRTVIAW